MFYILLCGCWSVEDTQETKERLRRTNFIICTGPPDKMHYTNMRKTPKVEGRKWGNCATASTGASMGKASQAGQTVWNWLL
jgi:hypothetical protein